MTGWLKNVLRRATPLGRPTNRHQRLERCFIRYHNHRYRRRKEQNNRSPTAIGYSEARRDTVREIQAAIFNSHPEEKIAQTCLQHLAQLTSGFHAGCVFWGDPTAGDCQSLSYLPELFAPKDLHTFLKTGAYLDYLKTGKTLLLHDAIETPDTNLEKILHNTGAHSAIITPVMWDRQVNGLIFLRSTNPAAFHDATLWMVESIAAELAIAMQYARIQRVEAQSRQEADMMRDVMASLAGSGNLKQTLEIILVNLHNLIRYDRAGLFLADESQRYVMIPERTTNLERAPDSHTDQDLLVSEMRANRKPIVITDVRSDKRFVNWPDMAQVRSWLGAPLLAGDEMIGFLGLASLEPGAYTMADAEIVQGFALQIAAVLEKAWEHEQAHRHAEDLEVLSNFTLALGRAETAENTLQAIVEQVRRFFDANRSIFLVPDRSGTILVVQVCEDESLIGLKHPSQDDFLWRVLQQGEAEVIVDVPAFLKHHPAQIYQSILRGDQSALAIPLETDEGALGILFCSFSHHRTISSENLRLYKAVAEIAGVSLRRAILLETLEKQVSLRTHHLNTLYYINAASTEPQDLQGVLETVLDITLESLHCDVGVIHFLDDASHEMYVFAKRPLITISHGELLSFSMKTSFWRTLFKSPKPLVLPDLRLEPNLPDEIARLGLPDYPAYLGAPIKAKGQALGLLSLFCSSINDYTQDDITLFMTIADQIGSLVERARLTRQAEIAAVVQERQRLARELHDSVTQLLYGQVLFSGAGLKVMRQGNLPLAEQHMARIEQAAQQALKEMRLMIYQLRPSDYLEDEGLVGTLERRLDSVERRTGINAQVLQIGDLELDPHVEGALYRIAEEALNNTLKHAQATQVFIRIERMNNKVHMQIVDNGQGFDAERPSPGGMGLINMYQRAAELNGSIEIVSALNQGTKINVEVEVKQ